jgi:hypothetical protein
MDINTIKKFEELESIRTHWECWQTHPNCDYEHFQLVCRLRQEVICPHVAVMNRDGQPFALILARLENSYFTPAIGYIRPFRIPAKVLTVLLDDGLMGTVDDISARRLMQYLWSLLGSGETDAVIFNQLHEDSPLLRVLLKDGPRWWCEKKPTWTTHWSMDLPKHQGVMLKSMRKNHRKRTIKKQRELELAFPGNVSWRWYDNFDDIPGLCNRLEKAAACTYQRGLSVGFENNEEYRERFALFARRKQLRAQLLEIEGRICAFMIGVIYKGVFHATETGYQPNLRKFEVGTLCFIRTIDELAEEGVKKLDFGLGDAIYKHRFGDQNWRGATVRMFAPNAKGAVLRSVLGASKAIDGAAKRLLQKAGVLDRIKTGWRRHLLAIDPEIDRK